jgi:GntR family transcriptional repressor for pyruvate dehydrogenase complex
MGKQIFPKIGSLSLQVKVYDLLLDMIVDGKLKVGELLPSENDLSEQLGVSRTVIREAIKSLETRGVVTVAHGKGIKVNPVNSREISNAFMLYLRRRNQEVPLIDLLEFRKNIEPQIAELAAKKANRKDIQKLDEILDRMQKAKNDMDLFNKIDLEYHLELARMTKNIFIITIIEELLIPLRKHIEATADRNYDVVYKFHHDIVQYIKKKDHGKAREVMLKSLEHLPRGYRLSDLKKI